MNIQDFIRRVPTLSKERDYWFIRADGGAYYDDFYTNGYVAIGWNNVTIEDLRNGSRGKIAEKVARAEKLDLKKGKHKSAATGIVNKLLRFNSLQQGDVVVVPSNKSSRWAFGTISDKKIYSNDNKDGCPFQKRRRVVWQKEVPFYQLDPIFNEIKSNQHSLSSINSYASYIDIVSNVVYYKGDDAHLVLNVTTDEEINAKEFFELGTALIRVMEIIETELKFNENINETSLRLYLQSPGKIDLKSLSKKCLVTLGMILALNEAQDGTTMDSDVRRIMEKAPQEINTIKKSADKLGVNTIQEIRKYFKN